MIEKYHELLLQKISWFSMWSIIQEERVHSSARFETSSKLYSLRNNDLLKMFSCKSLRKQLIAMIFGQANSRSASLLNKYVTELKL